MFLLLPWDLKLFMKLLGLNEKALSSEQEQGQDRQRMDVGAAINADSTTIPA